MARLLRLLLLLLLCSAAFAEEPPAVMTPARIKEIGSALDGIEQNLGREGEPKTLAQWLKQLADLRAESVLCVSGTEERLNASQADLKTLGAKVTGEDAAVTQKRTALEKNRATLDKQLGSCRLLLLRSDELFSAVTRHQQALLAQHLTVRGPSVVKLLRDDWQSSSGWLAELPDKVAGNSGLRDLTAEVWGAATFAVVAAWLAGWRLGRHLRERLRSPDRGGFAHGFRRAAMSVLARYAPRLFASIGLAAAVWLFAGGAEAVPFIALAAYGLPLYFLFAATLRLLLSPPPPASLFLPVDPQVARSAGHRLRVLGLLVYGGYLFFSTLFSQSLPEPAVLLARAVFAAALVLNLVWAIWLFRRLTRREDLNWFRATTSLLLVGAAAAEWAGYRNLSVFVLGGVLGTSLAAGLGMLVARLFRDLFDGLDSGAQAHYRELRHRFGIAPGSPFPGLPWLRFLTTLAVWGAVAIVVLWAWGAAQGGLAHLHNFLAEGFAVGSLRVVPSRILFALLILALLLPVSRWLRVRLEKHWLRKTYLDRGAREALVTVSGYLSVGLTVVIALGVAGVDFGNLALIAGALSVGIGFGLQNVVNNFVSGLILLFERPIKTGDWIIVGSTEGYVKSISIRSTRIETFDRADVIVPNSELVSGQVTNWMLRDQYGRVAVPVGVAYGSDTRQVEQVLLEVARAHPQVVLDGRLQLPPPVVLFRRFGDDALEFELRCFILKIDLRLQVISDLNFAIEATFHERGIEIPYKQRDIRIRNWPPPGDPALAQELTQANGTEAKG